MEGTNDLDLNRCRACSALIERWFAWCERHAEGGCRRCDAGPEEDCKPGCPNAVVDPELQGHP